MNKKMLLDIIEGKINDLYFSNQYNYNTNEIIIHSIEELYSLL